MPVPPAMGEEPGPGGAFVSGDRGEWHENLLYIAGRVDSVVKVRAGLHIRFAKFRQFLAIFYKKLRLQSCAKECIV